MCIPFGVSVAAAINEPHCLIHAMLKAAVGTEVNVPSNAVSLELAKLPAIAHLHGEFFTIRTYKALISDAAGLSLGLTSIEDTITAQVENSPP